MIEENKENLLKSELEGLTLGIVTNQDSKLYKKNELENVFKSTSSFRSDNKENMTPNQDIAKASSHHPILIDEDITNFTTCIDTVLSSFRGQALKDFITIKRNLLLEQSVTIQKEQEKFNLLLATKENEYEKLREEFVNLNIRKQNLDLILDKLSLYSKKMKIKTYSNIVLSKVFQHLKQYSETKKHNKYLLLSKQNLMKFSMKRKIISAWANSNRKYVEEKRKTQFDKRMKDELCKLSIEYSKEIEILKNQLTEVNKTLESETNKRQQMQEGLKKAFMRGVCALNFEAMNVFQEGAYPSKPENSATSSFSLEPNMILPMEISTNSARSVITNTQNPIPNPQINVSERAIESKDHLWKPAPIIGNNMFIPQNKGPVIHDCSSRSTDQTVVVSANMRNIVSSKIEKNENNSEEVDIIVQRENMLPETFIETKTFTKPENQAFAQSTSHVIPEGKVIRVNTNSKQTCEDIKNPSKQKMFNNKNKVNTKK